MRTKQLDPPAKNKLMQVAKDLILKKGFSATSVDEICERSGLTKGSFFHYFKSKDSLGEELLRLYCQEKKNALSSCGCLNKKDPWDRVLGLIDYLMLEVPKHTAQGCLLGSMAQEMSQSSKSVKDICCQGFDDLSSFIASNVREAQKISGKKSVRRPEDVGDYFVVTMQGAVLLAKARRDTRVIEAALKSFREYLVEVVMK